MSEGQLLGLAVVLISLAILIGVLKWAQLDVDAGLSPVRLRVRRRETEDRDSAKLIAAFHRYSDLTQGMGAVLDSSPEDDERLREWFGFLAESLAGALAAGSGDAYRVAIWVDDAEEDDVLHILAAHLLDTAVHYELSRSDSIAGLAARTGEECYLPDIRSDPRFRPLSTKSKTYRSLFAIPLGGDHTDPWGSMTVDGPNVSSFGNPEKEIVRRFGELADFGAYAWLTRTVADEEASPEANSNLGG